MTLSPRNPMRVVLLSVLLFEVIVFALAIPVMILVVARRRGCPPRCSAAAPRCWRCVAAGLLRKPVGYPVGWVDPARRASCSAC